MLQFCPIIEQTYAVSKWLGTLQKLLIYVCILFYF